jgi:hypothetical protein
VPAAGRKRVAGGQPPLTRRGEEAGRVGARPEYLYRSPGRVVIGTVFRGQPLSIERRSASGRWAQVISDTRNQGWLKARSLCR